VGGWKLEKGKSLFTPTPPSPLKGEVFNPFRSNKRLFLCLRSRGRVFFCFLLKWEPWCFVAVKLSPPEGEGQGGVEIIVHLYPYPTLAIKKSVDAIT
jgi:hypothetical protein